MPDARLRYPKIRAGAWEQPVHRGYKMRCCDCALVHRVDFRVVLRGDRLRVLFRAFRDERATAASRRRRKRK